MGNGLVLTLGHGSSAVLIKDDLVVEGYQLERLSGIKGDSRFPSRCIEHILKRHEIEPDIPIYVSHWHPSGNVHDMTEKHWNPQYIGGMFPESQIISTYPLLTHHDTHAWSAVAYNTSIKDGSHIMVADGFGTFGEVISIYEYYGGTIHLLKRVFGFEGSLGLLYQYATDYVGWKQNQDEWKLNACANRVLPTSMKWINNLTDEFGAEILQKQLSRNVGDDDPITNLGALSFVHSRLVHHIKEYFNQSEKAEIAFFLQTVVRQNLLYWIRRYGIEDCTFAGGCFLNVQLNGELMEYLNSTCIMPLCGDEGAGLGLYKAFNPSFTIPDDLCWGVRRFTEEGMTGSWPDGTFVLNNIRKPVEHYLSKDFIVNVVKPTMEFGPRAYCHTSTLALPTEANKAYINKLNDRDEHMPMCPVVTDAVAPYLFEGYYKAIRSKEHMILALPYRSNRGMEGVSYRLTNGIYTGRPQVISEDHWMYWIVTRLGPLINTSFNNHGQPIVYNHKQIIDAHNFMRANDSENRVVTLIEIP